MLPAPRPRWAPALGALAFATALTPSALAQVQTFSVDRLVMAGAPGDGIAIWRPDMSDQTRFFGQLGLGVSVNPLRAANIADNLDVQKTLKNPVSDQFMGYLNIGAEIVSRVSIQLALPVALYQAGNGTNVPGLTIPTPAHTAQGDLRAEARVVVFRTDARDFKLALNLAAYAPTGNKASYTGDSGPGFAAGLAAEYDARVVAITLNAGYRYRQTMILNELPVSSEVQYGLGAYVPLRRGTIRIGAELFGAVGANPNKQPVLNSKPPGASSKSNVGDLDATPLEWMLNGRFFFTAKRQVYVGLGAGTRLTGGFAPDFRAVGVLGASFPVVDTDPKGPGGRYVFETSDPTDTDDTDEGRQTNRRVEFHITEQAAPTPKK